LYFPISATVLKDFFIACIKPYRNPCREASERLV